MNAADRRMEIISALMHRHHFTAEEFETATPEQRKMTACSLFTRIEVGRGYEIRFSLNMTYQQFCSEWGGGWQRQ